MFARFLILNESKQATLIKRELEGLPSGPGGGGDVWGRGQQCGSLVASTTGL